MAQKPRPESSARKNGSASAQRSKASRKGSAKKPAKRRAAPKKRQKKASDHSSYKTRKKQRKVKARKPVRSKKKKRALSAKGRREKRMARGALLFVLCLMPFFALYGYRQYQARQAAGNEQEQEEIPTYADVYAINEAVQIQNIKEAAAGSIVDATGLSEESLKSLFTAAPLDDDQLDEMEQVTIFSDQMPVPVEDLVYLRLLHKDFDGNDRVGEMIVNKAIYVSVIQAFYELYLKEYPIEKMVLLDEYDGSLALSQTDNNTSAFSLKDLAGNIVNDRRSQGLVIDLNPFYNPQINQSSGSIFPESSMIYEDRDVTKNWAKANHMITVQDDAYLALTAAGFSWGGELVKDPQYQLFAYGKSEPLNQNHSSSLSSYTPAPDTPDKENTGEKQNSNTEESEPVQDESRQPDEFFQEEIMENSPELPQADPEAQEAQVQEEVEESGF